jgi:hypothetical protein
VNLSVESALWFLDNSSGGLEWQHGGWGILKREIGDLILSMYKEIESLNK